MMVISPVIVISLPCGVSIAIIQPHHRPHRVLRLHAHSSGAHWVASSYACAISLCPLLPHLAVVLTSSASSDSAFLNYSRCVERQSQLSPASWQQQGPSRTHCRPDYDYSRGCISVVICSPTTSRPSPIESYAGDQGPMEIRRVCCGVLQTCGVELRVQKDHWCSERNAAAG